MGEREPRTAHLTGYALLQAEEATRVEHLILNEEGDCLQVNPRWLQGLQVTHPALYTVAIRRANNADLFSLHNERNRQWVNPSGCST